MQKPLPKQILKATILLFWCLATALSTSAQSWQPLGPDDFNQPSFNSAAYPSLALDGSGTPYVAYVDRGNGYKTTVKKFNGTTWVDVGAPGFSAGQASFTSLALDGSGTPYVAYGDKGNGNKATVMKFNGTTWVDVGTPGFSAGQADYTS
ncbi:hypothetical protein, partial [Adhaeribacter soli]